LVQNERIWWLAWSEVVQGRTRHRVARQMSAGVSQPTTSVQQHQSVEPEPPDAESCPACDAPLVRCVGPLPPAQATASDWGVVDRSRTWLWLCQRCSLRFRSPVPPTRTILDRYADLKANDHWQQGIQHVWQHVRTIAMRCPERRILDVGCFRGDMLDWLGPEWDRYGIEPSVSASSVATSRGLCILGASVDDPLLRLPRLDVITLIDVIEHLPRPLDSLRRLAEALVSGGRLIIFTGDTSAPSWRLSGNQYWYCSIPEHIVFFSLSWFRWAAPRLGCSVGTIHRLAHDAAPVGRRLVVTAQVLAYLLARRLQASTRTRWLHSAIPALGKLARFETAWWTSAKDHLLVELVKDGDGPNSCHLVPPAVG
jgi:SAM-dependent methyltransferase